MSARKNKAVIIVAGPTAVGKTSVAIKLAKYFHTQIISADSRQCFKELKIGVARPSEEELKKVTHYFIASHSIHENINAAVFEQYALKKLDELFKKHDVVIMTGGTGLYIKAFCEGIDEIPGVPAEIRKKIVSKYEEKGLEWLQKKVKKKDPEFYKVGEIQNPRRLMRALEVMKATGKSILKFQKGKKATRDFNIIRIGLELPREELYRNINTRVDKMIQAGLIDEVKTLGSFKHINALKTVGYSEIFDYLDEKTSLEEAIELIKKNTRQYAKRQMTWFKKDKEIKWFAPGEIDEIKRASTDALHV
jgi:tRNA dimethylallyltransferase